MPAIIVDALTRVFEETTAVDRISFQVEEGELFGMLGPNGAGKTTTVHMLSTLLKPTSGHAWVAGFDVARSKGNVRRSIGVVFQDPALDGKLTGRENLQFHGLMYGLKRDELRRRVDEVLALVDLSDKGDNRAETYSGGMKRRLEIARGLMHRPKVLFLDEPTLGLDTHTRRNIWEYIRALNRDHATTVILTTHYMEEADALCDRILIMDYGRVVALDSPQRLKNIIGGDTIQLETAADPAPLAEAVRLKAWAREIRVSGSILHLTVEEGEARIPDLFAVAHAVGAAIVSVSLSKPSLEEVFLHYTGTTMRDEEAGAGERLRSTLRGHHRRRS
jgi:ABC-2 type transport system ATP-binding protein